MAFDTLSYSDYKRLLKDRSKWLKKNKPSLTLKRISERVPMQYTYLSKALNDEATHLNEDHLFRICKELEFFPDEIDYALLLRSHATAQQADRREHLASRIDGFRKKKTVVRAEHREFNADHLAREMRYLLDPHAVLIYVALFVKAYKKDPRRLCSQLGVSTARLKELLEILEQNELIETGESPFEIKKVHPRKQHFGKDHPLMRVHQGLIKSALHTRLQQTSEEDKESFLVTFSLDEKGFEATKQAFRKFLAEVQDIFEESDQGGLYQMSFDLVKWL